ncbi:MAG TPA: DUF6265 family protein [Gemmatimonadaceae bacterium]|nr:DUF6265 family protein [Gemmatimonadaceae bacterium]
MSALIVGTLLQLAMVLSGHWIEFIKQNVFAMGGMLISGIAAVLYARASGEGRGASAIKGAVVGGLCAFIGIAVSYFLGDVPANILIFGTLGSAVAGAIGGAIAGAGPARSVSTAVLVLLALSAASLTAQTKSGSRATTHDFAWLAGNWEGRVTGRPGTADISFAAPRAGTITGVMRLVDNNDKVLVVELVSLVDNPGGLEMRFRHFSPSLEAYETNFKQTMKLSDLTPERAVFENETPYDKTLMSTQPRITQFIRRGRNEFIGRSNIIDDKGQPAIIESVYRRK